MRIDSHQHFWRYTPREYAWIDDTMGVLRRDFLPSDLEPLLRASQIDGCVAVQAQETIEETLWLFELADRHDWIRGVVGWVNLCADDVEQQLDRIAHQKLVGVRAVLQARPDSHMALPQFRRGVAAALARGLAYDVLVYARQLRAAIDLCGAFPGQRLVLDHFGKPDVRSNGFLSWARDLRELAQMPHVLCKVSGLATEAHWQSWTEDDLRRYFDVAAEAFGPQRLLFGSDWPVALCATAYGRWVEVVDRWIAGWDPAGKAALRGGNAVDFYRLS
jgi:L-fuconolactonase